MKNIDEMNEVIGLLSKWIFEIKLSNAISYYDINKCSENLALKLLNEIYGYKLLNLNYENSHYPGIDLGDATDSLVAFQVTSRTDVEKFKDALKKFHEFDKDKIFVNGIRFLILNETNVSIKEDTLKSINPSFDKKSHIITPKTLIKEIEKSYSLDYEKFTRIKSILLEELSALEEIDNQIAKSKEYFQIKEYEKALEGFIELEGKVKNLKRGLDIKLYQGLCYYEIAITGEKKEDNLLRSIKYHAEAIDLAENMFNEITYKVLNSLGLSYFELSLIREKPINLEKSKNYQIEALKKCNRNNTFEYITIQNSLAVTYEHLAELSNDNIYQNLSKCIALYKNIIEKNEYTEEKLAGYIFNNLGRAFEKLSILGDEIKNLYESIEWYEKSLDIRTVEKYPNDYAMTQNNLGNVYLQLSEYESGKENYNLTTALEHYQEALEIRKESKDTTNYSMTLSNMGIVYQQLFKLSGSKEQILNSINNLNEALKYRKIQSNPIEYAYTNHNLGLSYVSLSSIEDSSENLDLAINSYNNSLKIFKKDKYEIYFIKVSVNLCTAYTKKSIDSKDLKYIKKAILNLREIIDTIDIDLDSYIHKVLFANLEQACIDFGNLASDLNEILENSNEIINIFKIYDFKTGLARIHNNIANTYLKTYVTDYDEEKINQAVNNFRLSLKYYANLDDSYNVAANYIGLGQAFMELYNIDKCKDNFETGTRFLNKSLEYFDNDTYPSINEFILSLREKFESIK